MTEGNDGHPHHGIISSRTKNFTKLYQYAQYYYSIIVSTSKHEHLMAITHRAFNSDSDVTDRPKDLVQDLPSSEVAWLPLPTAGP